MNGGRPSNRPRRGRGREGSRDSSREPEALSPEKIDAILNGDACAIVDGALEVATATTAKANQVRSIYAALLQVRQSKQPRRGQLSQLVLLKPRLEYTRYRVEKDRRGKVRALTDTLTSLIDRAIALGEEEAVDHIYAFGEALVAYHKARER